MDTLGRWLAHYLAEKMESAASAPEGAAGESARRECVDLILRLWERRQTWPLSAPLKDVADRLEELLRPKPRFLRTATQTSDPLLDLLRGLEDLHYRETQVCLMAWATGLDLSKTRAYLHDHPEHLDDDEHRLSQHLIELQGHMFGPEARLDGEPCPDFATLPKPEQRKIVRARLRAIAKSRTQLLGR
ncbi:hypothetical protein [Pseudothauera rhizosphaerae]|uniref:Uncharacterized protein n=1 Tax=Pseudothauera rhizosphaerae TaxID=2565932 RepID=A0A4S4AMJ3_9RHOO|nr:hypothetical protein [Pseudothauera rhizosphaerae]THF60378.1 hypothetical protein E6O51_14345 [Pseudothauera rhizosphaerae]